MRDALPKLSAIGVSAVGVSPDGVDAQKRFDGKHGLGFPLLSDADHSVAEAYGAWGEKSMYGKKFEGIIRSSFLIGPTGKIIDAWIKIRPDDTVPKALADFDMWDVDDETSRRIQHGQPVDGPPGRGALAMAWSPSDQPLAVLKYVPDSGQWQPIKVFR